MAIYNIYIIIIYNQYENQLPNKSVLEQVIHDNTICKL